MFPHTFSSVIPNIKMKFAKRAWILTLVLAFIEGKLAISSATNPVVCTESNKGHCECSTSSNTVTYVFQVPSGTTQITRCFTVYSPPSATTTKLPVMLHVDCYAKDVLGPLGMEPMSRDIKSAERYGYALIGISTPAGKQLSIEYMKVL